MTRSRRALAAHNLNPGWSSSLDDLQSGDANKDQRKKAQPDWRCALPENDHPSDRDAERPNSDPYCIGGPNRQALEGHRKHITKLTRAATRPMVLGQSCVNPSEYLSAMAHTISSSPAVMRRNHATVILLIRNGGMDIGSEIYRRE
jgi:hypothetical protein